MRDDDDDGPTGRWLLGGKKAPGSREQRATGGVVQTGGEGKQLIASGIGCVPCEWELSRGWIGRLPPGENIEGKGRSLGLGRHACLTGLANFFP
jgi:hypothetical protein